MPDQRFARLMLAALLGVAAHAARLSAQQLRLAAGYVSMPGNVGGRDSDRGVAVRAGIDLVGGRRVSWGFEGGLDRLNEARGQSSGLCLLPSGLPGTCFFSHRERDTGWSLGSILRFHVGGGPVRPFALVGLGALSVRTRYKDAAADSAGNRLENFSGEGSSNDGALQGHVGAGLTIRPGELPFAVVLEGRATRMLSNYSGGLQATWNPSVTVGIRTGR